MRFIKRIKKNIKKRILNILVKPVAKEIDLINKTNSQKVFNSIFNKGKDSFFWGKDLYISRPDKVEIGTNVHVGNNAYIKSEGGLKIGNNTHISRNLVLYTVNHNHESDVLPYNDEMIEKSVVIGENVWIGMNVCITPGTTIGDGCIIGMGTIVSGEVPPLTIIGSQKWRKIGERDKEKYDEIVQKKRFGKENGLLYADTSKIVQNIGDNFTNSRTYIEIIDFNGKKAIKKTFEKKEEALKAFENEKVKYIEFKEFSWLPELYEVGDNYLIIEYLDNNFRLDQIDIASFSKEKKQQVLGDIMSCLLDMFRKNTAHCDIHSKNIFVTNTGIKIIDFETSQNFNDDVDFFDSYDITGEGLQSPYNTNSRCVLVDRKYSLKRIFEIKDKQHLKKLFNEYLLEQLYTISGSFFTRKNEQKRHNLKNRYIYSTFDLKHVKVDENIGQRNIKKRLKKYGISVDTVEDKNVLDIGSNIGGILFEITKMQPKSALGLEYDNDKVEISKRLKALNCKEINLSFERADVENDAFLKDFNNKYEVVFCLAVIEHLSKKDEFIQKLSDICLDKLYLEGNSGTDVDYIKGKLLEVGFSSVEFIGYSDDEKNKNNNNRPLFIAKK
jgi:acetyltransferase-like isoleucine patch superfamily enzyme